MSKSQDQFSATIVGNLVAEPNFVTNSRGESVCYCKIATNPKAQRTDRETGRELSAEERNKRRSFVDLKISPTARAIKFKQLFHEGDRAEVIGECGTRREKKLFWSKSEQQLVNAQLDVDNDGQNIQDLHEEHLMMWVADFSKIVIQEGCVTKITQG